MDAHNSGVSLTDAKTRRLVLMDLIDMLSRLDETRIEQMGKDGMTAELADGLTSLSADEVSRLAESLHCHVLVRIDWRSIALSLKSQRDQRARQALIEFFLTHGASRQMMRRLFGLTDAQYRLQAASLGIATSRRGRKTLPCIDQRDAIGRRWYELSQREFDRRERYVKLHQAFPTLSIAVLDEVTRQFDESLAPVTRTSVKSTVRTHGGSVSAIQ